MQTLAPQAFGTKPFSTIITLTPELSKELLARARNIRVLDKNKVAQYARAMKRGDWLLSNDDLTIDTEGFLSNGQHRCEAVIETEIPIEIGIKYNVPVESAVVMDTGKSRTLSTYLTAQGMQYSREIAGAVQFSLRWERGLLRTTIHPTIQEGLAWLEQNPGIKDSAHMGKSVGRATGLTNTIMAAIYYRFKLEAPADAEAFFSTLASGENIAQGNPIFALRRWAANSKKEKQLIVAAVTTKAINAWLEGRNVDVLAWKSGGSSPESFPVLEIPEYAL